MALLANILVLDDEADTQDLFLQKFRHQVAEGIYKFSFVTCQEDALLLLENEQFDIFVSDISVAGMDGIGLINNLKKTYPLMLSVVVSAYGDINTLRAVMRGGAHDFVIKPIDFSDLMATIENTANIVVEMKKVVANSKKLTAISDELDVSAKLQKSILPGNTIKRDNIEVWADSISAAEVGGDFYDYFWLDDHRLGIVMADVSGKNVSAAMFALIAKTLIKSFSKIYESPAECFKNVNMTLCGENVTTMFVTAMYGIIDMEKNEILYTNAGHLPIAVVAPEKQPIFLECDPGMALGIFDETEFSDNVYKFSSGDMIIMYTDGVTEAANPEGKEYDFDRFAAVLAQNTKATPHDITEKIVADIRQFADGAPQSDDITTLCLKYRLRISPNVT